jgi:hypothetical protein
MDKPKRYGSRGTIKRDKPDDTIANPNEKEQRARNQAMWGTETMLHEFWKQNVARGKKFWGSDTHETTDIDKDKDFKWTDAGGALMGYTKDQVEQQRKHNKRRKEN